MSVRQIYLQNYFTLFGIAILTYDHIITFGEEYQLIWRVKFKKASLVFFLNRYLGVIYMSTLVAVSLLLTKGTLGRVGYHDHDNQFLRILYSRGEWMSELLRMALQVTASIPEV